MDGPDAYNQARIPITVSDPVVPEPETRRPIQIEEMSLDALSERLRISKQTLVRWVDRHLIKASLGWALSDDNEDIRVIELSPETIAFLDSFSDDYREDTVTRTQARRMLKKIDRSRVKKMIRAGDILAVEEDGEVRIVVGSIEDYLMDREGEEEER